MLTAPCRLNAAQLALWVALSLSACAWVAWLVNRRGRRLRQAALHDLAVQVAHDVRSPLAALGMVAGEAAVLPAGKQALLRASATRLEQICGKLLALHAPSPPPRAAATDAPLALRQLGDIATRLAARTPTAGFVCTPASLPREAFVACGGPAAASFFVSLIAPGLRAGLTLCAEHRADDDGHALRIRLVEPGGAEPLLTPQLARRAKTLGIGVRGSGHDLTLAFAAAAPPAWHVRELRLGPQDTVVVVDDDDSIHRLWDARLQATKANVAHLYRPQELEARMLRGGGEALFLVDFELGVAGDDGLRCIMRHGLSQRAILVSSHAADTALQERCEVAGMRLLDKRDIGELPIAVPTPAQLPGGRQALSQDDLIAATDVTYISELVDVSYLLGDMPQPGTDAKDGAASQAPTASTTLDAVLLDDDLLVHDTWAMAARQGHKNVRMFSSPDSLFAALPAINPTTPIYVDYSLGEGQSGLDVSRVLAERGYGNLFITTGLSPQGMPRMPWVASIVGKAPPWSGAVAAGS